MNISYLLVTSVYHAKRRKAQIQTTRQNNKIEKLSIIKNPKAGFQVSNRKVA